MKRVFAVLALALCLLPVMAQAAISVNGNEVTPNSNGEILIETNGAVIEGSAEGVTLWATEGVSEMTLKNVNITAREDVAALIILSERITLNVEGGNTLTGVLWGDGVNTSADVTIHLVNGAELITQGLNGILAGALAVTGSGTLKAFGGFDPDYGWAGIWLEGDSLTIGEKVTVIAEGGNSSSGGGGNGVHAFGDVKNGGTLTATGGASGEFGGDGVFALGDVENSGTLTGNGGAGGEFGGSGVHALGDVENSGTLTGTGGAGEEIGGSGVRAEGSVVNSGTLTATGGAGGDFGGDGVYALGDVENNGTLTGTGGAGGEIDGSGVRAEGSVVNNGTLTATDGKGMEGDAEQPMINPAELPKTGDSSNPVLWLALLGLAGAGMLLLRRKAHG